jgi:hypothetical protein
MQVNVKQVPPPFQPVEMTVRFESKDELQAFLAVLDLEPINKFMDLHSLRPNSTRITLADAGKVPDWNNEIKELRGILNSCRPF